MNTTPDELREKARLCREDAEQRTRYIEARNWCTGQYGWAPATLALPWYANHLDRKADRLEKNDD